LVPEHIPDSYGVKNSFAWCSLPQSCSSAGRSPAQLLAAGLPRQDHVYITSDQLFRVQNNEFNETPFKLDLDAANLRPALEHVWGKQTPSASTLFLPANWPYASDIKM